MPASLRSFFAQLDTAFPLEDDGTTTEAQKKAGKGASVLDRIDSMWQTTVGAVERLGRCCC
jgi:hypothetical protein